MFSLNKKYLFVLETWIYKILRGHQMSETWMH